MFDYKHYVPILKGKEGEYGALSRLTTEVISGITPLIEIPPIPWDYVNECEDRTIDYHLSKVAEKIEHSWDKESPLFLDLDASLISQNTDDGRHSLTYVLDNARDRSLNIIPVTGLKRDDDYQRAVMTAIQQDEWGLCIRLNNDDFEDLSLLINNLNQYLATYNLLATDIDLLIDFKEVQTKQANMILLVATTILNSLTNVDEWRTLTIAGTAFPEDLSQFSPNSRGFIHRVEWSIWQALFSRRDKIPRMPTFGDYAIANPEIIEVDPRIMRMSANLRYTTDEDWFIFKGRDVKLHGYEQFNDLCSALTVCPEYKGANYSWGDEYISQCASGNAGPGNAMQWRRIGTNHHLTLVMDQVSNYTLS